MNESLSIDELVAEHARCWQAVGAAEMGEFYDPGLKYKKQEALEATQALKDAIAALSKAPTVEIRAEGSGGWGSADQPNGEQ